MLTNVISWLKENKFGAATFWVRYLFLGLYLFSGTFFRDLLERISLFCKSLLPFLTSVSCKGPYLVEGFLQNLCSCFDIVFAPLGLITRTSNNIVKIAVTSECYLIIKIVGNYTITLANTELSEFHFQFPIRSII